MALHVKQSEQGNHSSNSFDTQRNTCYISLCQAHSLPRTTVTQHRKAARSGQVLSLTSLNNAGDQRQGKTQSLAGLYISWCAVISDDTTVCSSSGSSQLERPILRSCSCQTARQLTAKNPYYSRQIKPHVNTFYSRCVLRC